MPDCRALNTYPPDGLQLGPSSLTGRLLASHGSDRDYQVAVWAPTVSGTAAKQQGRIRLKESFDALAFAGEERLAAINCQSLVGAGGALFRSLDGRWVLMGCPEGPTQAGLTVPPVAFCLKCTLTCAASISVSTCCLSLAGGFLTGTLQPLWRAAHDSHRQP